MAFNAKGLESLDAKRHEGSVRPEQGALCGPASSLKGGLCVVFLLGPEMCPESCEL